MQNGLSWLHKRKTLTMLSLVFPRLSVYVGLCICSPFSQITDNTWNYLFKIPSTHCSLYRFMKRVTKTLNTCIENIVNSIGTALPHMQIHIHSNLLTVHYLYIHGCYLQLWPCDFSLSIFVSVSFNFRVFKGKTGLQGSNLY